MIRIQIFKWRMLLTLLYHLNWWRDSQGKGLIEISCLLLCWFKIYRTMIEIRPSSHLKLIWNHCGTKNPSYIKSWFCSCRKTRRNVEKPCSAENRRACSSKSSSRVILSLLHKLENHCWKAKNEWNKLNYHHFLQVPTIKL